MNRIYFQRDVEHEPISFYRSSEERHILSGKTLMWPDILVSCLSSHLSACNFQCFPTRVQTAYNKASACIGWRCLFFSYNSFFVFPISGRQLHMCWKGEMCLDVGTCVLCVMVSYNENCPTLTSGLSSCKVILFTVFISQTSIVNPGIFPETYTSRYLLDMSPPSTQVCLILNSLRKWCIHIAATQYCSIPATLRQNATGLDIHNLPLPFISIYKTTEHTTHCSHLTCWQSNAQNSPNQASKGH